MTHLNQDDFRALQRNMLALFVHDMFAQTQGAPLLPNWHIQTICWHLEQVARGNCRRLIITMPPRSLKSFIGSVAFPAWVLGRNPNRKILTMSYSRELSTRLTGDYRQLTMTPAYRQLFPWMRPGRKNTETEQYTSSGGFRYATSVGGTLTGQGGDILIVDDPIKADGAMSEAERNTANTWFRNTVFTRLDNKASGSIVILMQRLHQDDLVGHLTEHDGHGWTVVDIPAIATEACRYRISDRPGHEYYNRAVGEVLHPAREPPTILDEIRRNIGSARFAAQYQQTPLPPGGNLIHREWLVEYDNLPNLEEADAIIQSWDTAANAEEHNDFSVCTTWAVFSDQYYLVHVLRRQMEFWDLRQAALAQINKHRANIVLVEKAGTGHSLYQELRDDFRQKRREAVLKGLVPKGDKTIRVEGVTAMLEQGRVHIPRDAPWRDAFLKELLGFPSARHDDQVDSVEQFLRFMRRWSVAPKFDQATGRYIPARRERR